MVMIVRVNHKNANEIMDIVRELRAQGLVQGIHFDFAYNQASYESGGWEAVEPRHTIFKFHIEKYGTLFALKYSS